MKNNCLLDSESCVGVSTYVRAYSDKLDCSEHESDVYPGKHEHVPKPLASQIPLLEHGATYS
jgi:hypothetical protein